MSIGAERVTKHLHNFHINYRPKPRTFKTNVKSTGSREKTHTGNPIANLAAFIDRNEFWAGVKNSLLINLIMILKRIISKAPLPEPIAQFTFFFNAPRY